MTETLVQWFVTHLGGKAAKELIIFIISMIPILELRGGILAAGPAFLNIPTWRAIPICLVGNLIPIPSDFCMAAQDAPFPSACRKAGEKSDEQK